MKKVLTLSVALMLCATAAMAQVSFNINDCSPYTTGLAINNAASNTCLSNSGTAFAAWCSMVMPAVTRQQFVGAQGVIDITSSQATLPDWWRQDTCRPSGFVCQADGTMGGSCPTLWDTNPGAGANLGSIYGVHGANTIRMLLGQVLPSISVYDLTGDGVTELSVFKYTVTKGKSVGTGACTGCSYGTCLVLNEINLQTLTDTPATFLRLTGPIAGAADYITYNAGAPPCPGSTPTQNHTWGSVKALYR